NFRVDLTLDYEWPGEFEGRLPCPAPCIGTGVPEFSTERADISAWTTLVNAYFDLANFGGLTPYVGAGLGASYVTTSDVNYTNPNGTTGTHEGDSKWNLAWALMAGVSYDISSQLALDVNYRYLNLGKAQTESISAGGLGSSPIVYDDLAAHEFRVGLRYMIY